MLLVTIKWYRGRPWGLVNLSDARTVLSKFERLDDLRLQNTTVEEGPRAWYNVWGWLERIDQRNVRQSIP